MAFKPKFLFLSSGIAKLPQLAAFFPEFDLQYVPFFTRLFSFPIKNQAGIAADETVTLVSSVTSVTSAPTSIQNLPAASTMIAAWGRKPTARKAEKLAQKFGLPLARLEDGFLCSVKPSSKTPLSLILDQTGIYYDATAPSDLELAIIKLLTPEQIKRAEHIGLQWCKAGVSKYNHSPDISEEHLSELTDGQPFLLLVDQTLGDASVRYGQASTSSFEEMLSAALTHPKQLLVLVKLHPEVVSGKKQGYLSELIKQSQFVRNLQIKVINWDVHLPSLLTQATALYTVSSQSGFEGLLHGITVHTFGMPFYAGWGLTVDSLPAPARRSSATLAQLIYATLVAYPRYIDPHTEQLTQVEETIAYLKLQRKNAYRFGELLTAQGFSPNKLAHLKRFIQGGQWVQKRLLAPNAKAIAFHWGAKGPVFNQPASHQPVLNQLRADAPGNNKSNSKTVVQVEDGFIRSVGLGAMLHKPYSWIFDRTGMYYDATRPSDLETYLQNHSFTDAQLTRASTLQNLLVQLGISKYNLVENPKAKLATFQSSQSALEEQIQLAKEDNRPIALVIGQVETDASIRLGSVDIQTNLQLAQTVRDQFPNAFLIYKPHPDVQAGLRKGNKNHTQITALCDVIETKRALPELLTQIDELHTISSLSGFEALLRDIPVHCYGLPFYAGWGLTTDRHICTRRTRKLTLPQLIYGALIHYPSYLHPKTGAYCTPEDLCKALDQIRTDQNTLPPASRPLFSRISQLLTWRAMQIYHYLCGL